MKNVLSGRRQCGDGSAVEGINQCYNFLTAAAVFIKAVLSGHLDSTFISFCAGIAQEYFFHIRQTAQFLGNLCL